MGVRQGTRVPSAIASYFRSSCGTSLVLAALYVRPRCWETRYFPSFGLPYDDSFSVWTVNQGVKPRSPGGLNIG